MLTKVLPGSLICAGFFVLSGNNLSSDPVEIFRSGFYDNSSNATIINIAIDDFDPVISNISVTSVTAGSAIINWTTNVAASSQVNYGTTTSYGLSTLTDVNLVTSHSMTLFGLAPNTLYHYRIRSADAAGGVATSSDNTFTSASLASSIGTLNTHTIFAYPAGKVVPWTPNPTMGYDTVMDLAWNYLLNTVPNDPSTGKPAYYSRSYINPNTQQMVDWDHNPAGLYGMLIESALKYYAYSGNANVMTLANAVALWHLDHGMTTANDNWASVPYSEGPYGSLTYNGANQADGVGNLEPDKIGELGYGWLQLYKYNGNIRFRDAAIQCGNVLASKVRTGNMTTSPWPFRVKASNGAIIENYCANVIGPVALLDGLIAAGLGNTTAYQTARTTAWNWMMTYPMQNNKWAQYFEDVSIQGNYDNNLNQYDAGMAARYLMEHPEYDANWETHVRGIITWIENIFGQQHSGATIIKEQTPVFPYAMGSHTSRYASVNALLYEKTGDPAAKEKAYRSFNWATYMARSNGVVIDGLLYGSENNANQWFTDGYGDYIRHFMTGLGAIPEWSPANQTHLLLSTTVIKNITYGASSVNYTTYDGTSTEVLHINFNPVVTANGVLLQQRSDLNQPGWILDINTKTLKIYHTNATQINITAGSATPPANSNTTICPGTNALFVMPDPGTGYTYQWQIDSTGNGFVDLLTNHVHTGVTADTLLLTLPPTSYYGFKYRCIATQGASMVTGATLILKFAATWQGGSNTAWNNVANWSCDFLPDGFTDVIIPGSLTNYPVINTNTQVRCIITSPGTTLTVNPGVTLNIKGN